jgi:hypothetical protein
MKSLNILRALALVGAAVSLAPSAMAQTVGATIGTTVNLTSVCRWQGGTAPSGVTVDFGAYTAFGGAVTASSPTVTYECTRSFGSLTPGIGWDGGTAYGVVGGLNYVLTASAARTPGAAATAVLGGTGGADTFVITLGGSMPGGQAGAGPSGVATGSRTLTVTY